MPIAFHGKFFTPAVKKLQEAAGSRAGYQRFEKPQYGPNSRIDEGVAQFAGQMEGFYMGTVSSEGYPYIQFRGGRPGFLRVVDDRTLGFADLKGNRQYISLGNLQENDKAYLFLMDYRNQRRLKLFGRARASSDPAVIDSLRSEVETSAVVERAILFEVEGWDWNCPQHIPKRYPKSEVDALRARVAELEGMLGIEGAGANSGSDDSDDDDDKDDF